MTLAIIDLTAMSGVKIPVGPFILLVLIFIAVSVISGILTFKFRTKKLRDQNKDNDQNGE